MEHLKGKSGKLREIKLVVPKAKVNDSSGGLLRRVELRKEGEWNAERTSVGRNSKFPNSHISPPSEELYVPNSLTTKMCVGKAGVD